MRVRIMSKMEAIQHSYLKEVPTSVIVSITAGGDHTPYFYNKEGARVKAVFGMHFDDIDREYNGYKACQESDFEGLKDFLDTWKTEVEEVIVHCHAGISRSSGCAAAICQYLQIDDSFIWSSGRYIPNRRVYKMARMELGILRSEEEIKKLFQENCDAQERLTLFNDIFLGDYKDR